MSAGHSGGSPAGGSRTRTGDDASWDQAAEVHSAATGPVIVPRDRERAGSWDERLEVVDRYVCALVVVHPDRLERVIKPVEQAERGTRGRTVGRDRILTGGPIEVGIHGCRAVHLPELAV